MQAAYCAKASLDEDVMRNAPKPCVLGAPEEIQLAELSSDRNAGFRLEAAATPQQISRRSAPCQTDACNRNYRGVAWLLAVRRMPTTEDSRLMPLLARPGSR